MQFEEEDARAREIFYNFEESFDKKYFLLINLTGFLLYYL
jgi:hypothetical protein